jgi:septal ring factor EnvC (AmiA/AmiB activator)
MALVLDGKIPTTRSVAQPSDSTRMRNLPIVRPTYEDSVLRLQIESGALYARVGTAKNETRKGGIGIDLVPPVKGVVGSHFAPKENRYGVSVATASEQQVVSVADGTIVLSFLTPTQGWVVQVQHGENLLSIYRHCAEVLKSTGSRIKAGDVIAYTGEGATGEGGTSAFGFELWQSGLPVDPENFIVF